MSDLASNAVILQFSIASQIPDSSETRIRAAVEQALSQAIAAARAQYEVKAEAEVEGSFLGVGEGAVILTILHLAEAGGIAFGKGAIGAAGAAFFTAYVAPRLRALNILPGEPKVVTSSEPVPTLTPTSTTNAETGVSAPVKQKDGEKR
jgi:hypothetical protein